MKNKILIGILVTIFVGTIIFTVFSSNVDANITTMIGSILGFLSSAFLGVIALYQNEIYKRDNDISNARLLKLQILSNSPFFILESFELYEANCYEILIKNIGKNLATWVEVLCLEIYDGKKNILKKNIWHDFNNIHVCGIEKLYVTDIDKLKLKNEQKLVGVVRLAIKEESQIYYEQEIKFSLICENQKLKFDKQIDLKFTEINLEDFEN